jgi:hypothetical protein
LKSICKKIILEDVFAMHIFMMECKIVVVVNAQALGDIPFAF